MGKQNQIRLIDIAIYNCSLASFVILNEMVMNAPILLLEEKRLDILAAGC